MFCWFVLCAHALRVAKTAGDEHWCPALSGSSYSKKSFKNAGTVYVVGCSFDYGGKSISTSYSAGGILAIADEDIYLFMDLCTFTNIGSAGEGTILGTDRFANVTVTNTTIKNCYSQKLAMFYFNAVSYYDDVPNPIRFENVVMDNCTSVKGTGMITATSLISDFVAINVTTRNCRATGTGSAINAVASDFRIEGCLMKNLTGNVIRLKDRDEGKAYSLRNCTIEDVVIKTKDSSLTFEGMELIEITGTTFRNIVTAGSDAGALSVDFIGSGSGAAKIAALHDCIFESLSTSSTDPKSAGAVFVGATCASCVIVGCVFQSCTGLGAGALYCLCSNLSWSGCTFKDMPTATCAVNLDVLGSTSTSYVFDGMIFENVKNDGDVLFGIKFPESAKPRELTLYECQFRKMKYTSGFFEVSGGATGLDGLTLVNCRFDSVTSSSSVATNAVVKVDAGEFSVSGTEFANCGSNSAIVSSVAKVKELDNVTFRSVGVAFQSTAHLDEFSCYDCQFIGISSRSADMGCGLTVNSDSISFSRCVFKDPSSPNKPAIYIKSPFKTATVIDCTFRNIVMGNSVNGSAINVAEDISGTMDNCSMHGCWFSQRKEKGICGFYIASSTFRVTGLLFGDLVDRSYPNKPGVITQDEYVGYIKTDSTFVMENWTYRNYSRARNPGGFATIIVGATHIHVKGCVFESILLASANSTFLWNVTGSDVVFEDCVFRNVNGEEIGAIEVTDLCASCSISNCVFDNCLPDRGRCGAWYCGAKSFSVSGCTFKNITRNAFELKSTGSMVFENCAFDGCSNKSMPILFKVSNVASMQYVKCNFSNNRMIENGGAVLIDNGASCVIENCQFFNNSCGGKGGAIYGDAIKSISITNCVFDSCSASTGDAIFCNVINPELTEIVFRNMSSTYISEATTKSDLVSFNQCTWETITTKALGMCGCGISLKYVDTVAFSGCKFYSLSSIAEGSAISFGFYGINTGRVKDCEFDNCTAGGDGGAIFVPQDCELGDITNCHFIRCVGPVHAAVFCKSDDIKISNCTFEEMTSSKSVFYYHADGKDVEYSNLVFRNIAITAGGSGSGFLVNEPRTITLNDVEVTNVTCTGNGGGIILDVVNGGYIFINNCSFVNCYATDEESLGGAMWISHSCDTAMFTDLVVERCRASDYHAVRCDASSVNLVRVTFRQMKDGKNVGYFNSGSKQYVFESCVFEDLSYRNDSGCSLELNNPTMVNFTGCVFRRCTSYDQGGGYGVKSGEGYFENCTFELCSAEGQYDGHQGGGVFFDGTSEGGHVRMCIFDGCDAWTGAGITATNDNVEIFACEFRNMKSSIANFDNNRKSVTIDRCVFENIRSESPGGAGVSLEAILILTVTNCNFINCGSGMNQDGGAFFVSTIPGGKASFISCIFQKCEARGDGVAGALWFAPSVGEAKVINCVFDSCQGSQDVHGMYSEAANTLVQLSTFMNMQRYATLLFNGENQDIVVDSSSFVQNTGRRICGAGLVFQQQPKSALLSNCHFINNTSLESDGGALSVDKAIQVVNCSFTDNKASYGKGSQMYISAEGVTVQGCIFTVNSQPDAGSSCLYIENDHDTASYVLSSLCFPRSSFQSFFCIGLDVRGDVTIDSFNCFAVDQSKAITQIGTSKPLNIPSQSVFGCTECKVKPPAPPTIPPSLPVPTNVPVRTPQPTEIPGQATTYVSAGTQKSDHQSGSNLSSGAIAGIAIACFVVGVLIVALVAFLIVKRNRNGNSGGNVVAENEAETMSAYATSTVDQTSEGF